MISWQATNSFFSKGNIVIEQTALSFTANYLLYEVVNFIRNFWGNSLKPSDAYMRQQTNHQWSRQWRVAWPMPSHYPNQCWYFVYWTLRNKLQWNLNRNSYISVQDNAFENMVWKMAAILSRPTVLKKWTIFYLWLSVIENKLNSLQLLSSLLHTVIFSNSEQCVAISSPGAHIDVIPL